MTTDGGSQLLMPTMIMAHEETYHALVFSATSGELVSDHVVVDGVRADGHPTLLFGDTAARVDEDDEARGALLKMLEARAAEWEQAQAAATTPAEQERAWKQHSELFASFSKLYLETAFED